MNDEYRRLYAEIQERMKRGGDLSPGPGDTLAAFGRNADWDRARMAVQGEIVERFKADNAHKPQGGRAVLMTAGAPGAGKGFTQGQLVGWQREDSDLGRRLAAVHGLDLDDYVVLNPDDFKERLFEVGGAPRLAPEAMALSHGRELTPAELSGLLHREALDLRTQCEEWARERGYNLLYDATLANHKEAAGLLHGLSEQKYGQRIILSVEVTREQSLAQNADRWLKGRLAYERGEDPYGGRMSPDQMIKALYDKNTTGSGHSIGRENAEKLAEAGLATGLITTDRGTFAPTVSAATGPYRAVTFQRGETTLGITEAGRLRSPRAGTAPLTPSPRSPAPQAPDRTPPAAGRTR